MRMREAVVALSALTLAGGALLAQGRFRGSFAPVDEESLIHNVSYDGRFRRSSPTSRRARTTRTGASRRFARRRAT